MVSRPVGHADMLSPVRRHQDTNRSGHNWPITGRPPTRSTWHGSLLAGTPLVPPYRCLYTPASTATVREPGCLAVTTLLRCLPSVATVSFESTVHPSLIVDQDLDRERIKHLVERSDIIKVSCENLAGSIPTTHWSEPPEPGWHLDRRSLR